jgi:hypothetical protein
MNKRAPERLLPERSSFPQSKKPQLPASSSWFLNFFDHLQERLANDEGRHAPAVDIGKAVFTGQFANVEGLSRLAHHARIAGNLYYQYPRYSYYQYPRYSAPCVCKH